MEKTESDRTSPLARFQLEKKLEKNRTDYEERMSAKGTCYGQATLSACSVRESGESEFAQISDFSFSAVQ